MNRLTKIWMAVLSVAALTLASRPAHAQQTEDPSMPHFIGRVDCFDGRQCDLYRLAKDTQIARLWYMAQIAVERTIGRQILTDRQWWNYRLSDLQRPLDARVRRTGTLPALITASGAAEFVSLELLVLMNNGTNSNGRNPFTAPAQCHGRREHPLRYGLSSLNRFRRVREEVTLLNIDRLLPSGCESRGISTADGELVLIPRSGGSTIGQRMDQLTRDGLALIDAGTISLARLRQDRQQVREWESRRNVTVEPERQHAFDAYVDRALEVIEQRGNAAAITGTRVPPTVIDRIIKYIVPRDRVVYRDRMVPLSYNWSLAQRAINWGFRHLVWIALLVAYIGGGLCAFAFWRERKRAKMHELTIAQLCTRRDELIKELAKAAPLEKVRLVPQAPVPDLRPTLEAERKAHAQELESQRASYEKSLSIANQAKAELAQERDSMRIRIDELVAQIARLKESISILLSEAFHMLKSLYNEETIDGRQLQEPVSLISMIFSQLQVVPQTAPAGIHEDDLGRRPTKQAFASFGDALAKTRPAASRSNGNGNGGKKRRKTEPAIPSSPATLPVQTGNTLRPESPEKADSVVVLAGETTLLTDVRQIQASAEAQDKAESPDVPPRPKDS